MDFDPKSLKRDANGNVLRSELLRINKPVLRRLPLEKRRTIVRWLRGPKYWNAWAERMLAERKEMKEKGVWEIEKYFIYEENGLNKQTKEWLANSRVNLSDIIFCSIKCNSLAICNKHLNKIKIYCNSASFSGLIFPHNTSFKSSVFCSDICFNEAKFRGRINFEFSIFIKKTYFIGTSFSGAAIFKYAKFKNISDFWCSTFSKFTSFEYVTFLKEVNFESTKFDGYVNFKSVNFHNKANFLSATFASGTSFTNTSFYKKVIFQDTKFFKRTDFTGTIFYQDSIFWRTIYTGEIIFRNATFSGISDFWKAIFSGPTSFRLSTFKEQVDFSGTEFKGDADFSAINSQKSFNLREVRFHMVPNFSEAAFHAPPVLDEMHIHDQLRKRGGYFSFRSLPNVTPEEARETARRFRVLGKMAHEARDWLNEMEFFAQEIRVRRFGLDEPFGKGMGRFWFGWLYELFSDFGRSFARPLFWWLVSMLVFAFIYLGFATGGGFGDALAFSFRHGMIVSGLVRSPHYQQPLCNLFAKCGDVETCLKSPVVMLKMSNTLYAFTILQTVLSAFFLFLFLLAIRNHFRIR